MQKEHLFYFLDQQPHFRNYGRYVTVFPFPYARRADEAFRALCIGLAATSRQFPFLAGTLNVPDRTRGDLQLLHPDPVDMNVHKEARRILSIQFNSREFDFPELQAKHFDPSLFPVATFCPALLLNHPGLDDGDIYATSPTTFAQNIPLPVMAAQAKCIHRGMILSVWTHHYVANGAGAKRWYQVWAKNTREQTGSLDGVIQDKEAARVALQLDDLARSCTPGPVNLVSPNVKLRVEPYEVTTKLLRFWGDKIAELAGRLGKQAGMWVSPFIAISALLWAHILTARKANVPSTLAIVVDLRSRCGPPFDSHPDYLGNCVLGARSTYNTSQPLSPEKNLITIFANDIAHSV